MNEIKQIHLGRQAFTIAVDAHKELQQYLHAIEKAVGEPKQEVLEEVELRMAELLGERGISGDKVVLKADVEYLKQQLGQPGDFGEGSEDGSPEQGEDQSQVTRRFFRDRDNAMLAGVASGLAIYFGVPVLLIRILFVAFTITGGAAVLIYLLLWLLVPEAKTPSEKLQMQGKAVTVDTLKEVVDNIDTKAAAAVATRASYAFAGFIADVFRVAGRFIAAVLGTTLIVTATGVFLWAVAVGVFVLIGGHIGGVMTFPQGTHETLLVYCVIASAVLLSSIFLFAGISMFKRKWPVAGWIVGAVAGLFVLVAGIGVALAVDTAPRIKDRYDAMHHSQTVNVGAFKSLDLRGSQTSFSYEKSDKNSVEYRYFGKSDKKLNITSEVKDGVLAINTGNYDARSDCKFLCIYNDERLEVVVRGPAIESVKVDGSLVDFVNKTAYTQPSLKLIATGGASAAVAHTDIDRAMVEDNGGVKALTVFGLHPAAQHSDWYGGIASVSSDTVSLGEVKDIELKSNGNHCIDYRPWLYISGQVDKLTIDGQQVNYDQLLVRQQQGRLTYENCVIPS